MSAGNAAGCNCESHDPRRCRAHKKDGTQCGRYPLHGSTVCTVHGARAPVVRAAAQRRVMRAKAESAVLKLGLPVTGIDPQDALLQELGRSITLVTLIEELVRRLDTGAYAWVKWSHVQGSQQMGPVDYTEYRAEVHPLLVLYREERKHLASVTRIITSARIMERQAADAERLTDLMSQAITRAIDEVMPTGEQRGLLSELIPKRMLEIATGLHGNEG